MSTICYAVLKDSWEASIEHFKTFTIIKIYNYIAIQGEDQG
jgi:hypothetical protein